MDPNETWRRMLEAFEASDWEEAIELAQALQSWLRIDGFPPITSVGTPSLLIRIDDRDVNRQVADAVSKKILRHTHISR